jgi:hypothetical protein
MSKGYKVVRNKLSVNKPKGESNAPKVQPKNLEVKSVPKPTDEVLQPKLETVDTAPQHGEELNAHPTVCGGLDSGTGHWVGDGRDIRFVKNEGSDGHDEGVAGMSDRSFSITGAKGPNQKKK